MNTFRDLLNSMVHTEPEDTTLTESVDDPSIADDAAAIMDNEDDLENLSDEELDRLADELSDDINDDDIDAIDDMDDEMDELTPSQDAEADDMMNVAATSQLIQNEMNDEDRRSLVESVEAAQILVDEGFLLESDMDALMASVNEDDEVALEKSWYANRQRIELGKEARLKQLFSIAVFAEARARNDADYRKLQKVYKMRNILRARLEKKYQTPAKQRVRNYVARLKQSKNKVLAKIADRFSK